MEVDARQVPKMIPARYTPVYREESRPEHVPDPSETVPENPIHIWKQKFDELALLELLDKLNEERGENREVTSIDWLMLCLPAIAAVEAKRREEQGLPEDALGWSHLSNMLQKWLSSPAHREADSAAEPYWISLDWVMFFDRARETYNNFINKYALKYLLNTAACKQLGIILLRDPETASLNPGESKSFAFSQVPWQEWEAKYHTQRQVERSFNTDGSMAAMAGFSLRALADGEIRAEGNGKFRITVSSASVFAIDRFDFPTMTKLLGFWSCEKKEVSLTNFINSTLITDGNFNRFRDKFGLGGDFLTLSNPHKVEKFTRLEYVYMHKEKYD